MTKENDDYAELTCLGVRFSLLLDMWQAFFAEEQIIETDQELKELAGDVSMAVEAFHEALVERLGEGCECEEQEFHPEDN